MPVSTVAAFCRWGAAPNRIARAYVLARPEVMADVAFLHIGRGVALEECQAGIVRASLVSAGHLSR